ncbi:ankyrin repeat domain-containing protein [Mucilaginibacter sp. NFR10]|uniref:ankyrin repeat domain-containing protein n=1 Tax=unclassified Mucilaginibacter TaxID=2617802 RepID=UPI000871A222|nr:ankyrin repeat domain-containing protein [Mucilaginibacter sp. NFR10]SCW81171.1 Ankyrin repeat-containing protein [Mucilaginibacter sp. NFR10]
MTDISITQKSIADQAARDGNVTTLADFILNYGDRSQLSQWFGDTGYQPENSPEENARLIISHANYFDSWAHYEKFKTGLSANPSLQQFEQAADAIAAGDADTLKKLLAQRPGLINERSRRNHHSTLLNYVGANGFEAWRQKTPQNAVEIAAIILDAGAEVDAWGDMYRGTSTLGLVATSVHPVIKGIQEELMDILIRHGADPNHAVAADYTDGNLILACLHNGRYEPVRYLASKGAEVELEGAGGIGDLEKVKSYFNEQGELINKSMAAKRDGCLIWACVCGHRPVVEFLLNHGCGVRTVWDNTTPLHSAAYGGQVELVKMLLNEGADMEALNGYGGTVLGSTLWALYNSRRPGHLEIMEILIASGAVIKDDWQIYIDEKRAET